MTVPIFVMISHTRTNERVNIPQTGVFIRPPLGFFLCIAASLMIKGFFIIRNTNEFVLNFLLLLFIVSFILIKYSSGFMILKHKNNNNYIFDTKHSFIMTRKILFNNFSTMNRDLVIIAFFIASFGFFLDEIFFYVLLVLFIFIPIYYTSPIRVLVHDDGLSVGGIHQEEFTYTTISWTQLGSMQAGASANEITFSNFSNNPYLKLSIPKQKMSDIITFIISKNKREA